MYFHVAVNNMLGVEVTQGVREIRDVLVSMRVLNPIQRVGKKKCSSKYLFYPSGTSFGEVTGRSLKLLVQFTARGVFEDQVDALFVVEVAIEAQDVRVAT
jgi:hypothetical protein